MRRPGLTHNRRLYMAAWLYHWHLNHIRGEKPGAMRNEVKELFPWGHEPNLSMLQGYALELHRKIMGTE